MPVPPRLRRVARAAATSACDCSSSRRSPSGSSWFWNSSTPLQNSRLSVAPTATKKNRFSSIGASHPDIRDLPNHQNADDLGDDRIGEELAPDGVRPQQADVFRLQNPKPDPDDDGQEAQKRSRKALLRGVGLQLGRHVQAFAYQGRKVLQ